MATTAFRLSSRRSSIVDGAPEDSGSSNRSRRSRSLSRYSGRFAPPQTVDNEFSTPRGRFVNKVRGSGFPEDSLDDLADEFFGVRVEEEVELGSVAERSGRRVVRERLMADTESSRRRGRSVSRHHGGSTLDGGNEACVDRVNARQRRSISAARFRHNKLEFDGTDNREIMGKNHPSSCKNLQKPLLHKHNSEGGSLRRSISQKYFHAQDNCSSHSSSLTDDEEQGAHSRGSGDEKTLKEVYSQGKMDHTTGDVDRAPHHETVCKEVRNMVEELRTELEKVIGKAEPTSKLSNDGIQSICSNAVNTIAELRRSYSDKLEQSEKRKQELLAELAIEEQRRQELGKIMRQLLPASKAGAATARRSKSRQRSNDKVRISRCLSEDAERYFEDFLSNLEDTDLSSFDGEKSDAGSNTKLRESRNNHVTEAQADFLKDAAALPAETDGVFFPWLQWETGNEASPSPCSAAIKQGSGTQQQEPDNVILSSVGSWSPECNDSLCAFPRESVSSGFETVQGQMNATVVRERGCYFDMDEYLQLQHHSEDLLTAMWENRQRIVSGGMILCGRTSRHC